MNDTRKEVKWYEPLPEDIKKDKISRKKVKRSTMGPEKKEETGINFEKYNLELENWLRAIALEMELEERHDIAFQALRSVLHAIRDRSIPSEVFDLSAQLPLMVRGVFFEGYNLKDKPEKLNADEFLETIEMGFYGNTTVDAEVALQAVLKLLYEKISEGEMEDIYSGMPKDIKELWKNSLEN